MSIVCVLPVLLSCVGGLHRQGNQAAFPAPVSFFDNKTKYYYKLQINSLSKS